MDDNIEPALLVWENRFALGLHSFDEQHQQLLLLLNELYAEHERSIPDHTKLHTIAKELVDFTVYSLDYETDCLFQFGYPDILLHLEQHELFKEKISWYRAKLTTAVRGQEQLRQIVRNIWRFLYLWLNEHIANCDKKYTHLMLENGMI